MGLLLVVVDLQLLFHFESDRYLPRRDQLLELIKDLLGACLYAVIDFSTIDDDEMNTF